MDKSKVNEKELALNIIEGLFNEHHMLEGMFVLFPQTESIMVNNDYTLETKEAFVSYIKQYCQENNINRFYVASEAWISRRQKDDTSPITPPSKDPNKEEVLIVSQIKKDGDLVFTAAIIGNEAPGRFLGNWKDISNDAVKIQSVWDRCLS